MATEKVISVTAVCRQLGYSKQAYYKSLHARKLKVCNSSIIKGRVLSVRSQMPRLGTRKLHYLLKQKAQKDGITIGRDALFQLLRQEGLLISRKRSYTKTTNSKHWMHKYSNLVKNIEVRRPEEVWVADITYVAVADSYAYLHLITDAYSKQIVGYNVSDTLAASSTVKALEMAIAGRQYQLPLIHHSDHGLQYCSALYTKVLNSKAISISMTEDGSPYDNAIAERVNGILKDEFGLDEVFEDIKQMEKQVKQSICTYNHQRPHISNHMLTPIQMHNQQMLKPKSWHKKNQKNFERSFDFLPSLQH